MGTFFWLTRYSTIQHLLFANTGQIHFLQGKGDRAVVVFEMISYGAADVFATIFLLYQPCNIINFALSKVEERILHIEPRAARNAEFRKKDLPFTNRVIPILTHHFVRDILS